MYEDTNKNQPDCFHADPNTNNPYLLCAGNPDKMEECINCCLYEDLKSPYDEDIIAVSIPD